MNSRTAVTSLLLFGSLRASRSAANCMSFDDKPEFLSAKDRQHLCWALGWAFGRHGDAPKEYALAVQKRSQVPRETEGSNTAALPIQTDFSLLIRKDSRVD